MTDKTRHTPTPWEVDRGTPRYKYYLETERFIFAGNLLVAKAIERGGSDGANADFIVRACNHHDELLEVCDELLGFMDDAMTGIDEYGGDHKALESVVKKAEAILTKINDEK